MSNKKLKIKKAKAKERATYDKKVKTRLFNARKKRAERAERELEQQNQIKLAPITRKLQEIGDNLDHNLEILKALEEEFVETQSKRDNLNAELEAEGYKTIDEKMEAIRSKSVELAQKLQEKLDEEKISDND